MPECGKWVPKVKEEKIGGPGPTPTGIHSVCGHETNNRFETGREPITRTDHVEQSIDQIELLDAVMGECPIDFRGCVVLSNSEHGHRDHGARS
jgi:hypothetical protein